MGKLAIKLTLAIAAVGMLLPASGALAASKNRGAVLVKDINPARKSPRSGRLDANGSDPTGLTNVGGTLYFDARDRRHGDELWRSDGTRRGTRMVKDIAPGRPGSFPENLTAVGKTLYFTARDGVHGAELWRSNGTARGTTLVKDIVPGRAAYSLGSFTNVAGTLFFVATEAPQSGTAQTGLWRSNGTAAGTGLVTGLTGIAYPTALGNVLYLAASDGVHAGLWRSDGTTAGTTLVKELSGQNICGSASCYLTNVAGTLYFAAMHGPVASLWRSDGTGAGTVPVKDGVSAYELTAVGRTLYFVTRDYSDSWLWRSDGTAGGTVPIVSVGPTPEGCYCGLDITGFPLLTNVAGTLFFNGVGGLSRTDGTPNGTKALRSNVQADMLTAAGHTLYFLGTDQRHGQELWRSDGTRRGTRMVRDIRRGKKSSGLGELTAAGRTLFFRADDGRHGQELWRAGPKPK
jgi:ELWxxDGT repeat protein